MITRKEALAIIKSQKPIWHDPGRLHVQLEKAWLTHALVKPPGYPSFVVSLNSLYESKAEAIVASLTGGYVNDHSY